MLEIIGLIGFIPGHLDEIWFTFCKKKVWDPAYNLKIFWFLIMGPSD